MLAYTLKRTCNYSGRTAYYAGHGPLEIDGVTYPDHGTVPNWTKDPDLAAWTADEDMVQLDVDQWNDYAATHGNHYRYEMHTVTG